VGYATFVVRVAELYDMTRHAQAADNTAGNRGPFPAASGDDGMLALWGPRAFQRSANNPNRTEL